MKNKSISVSGKKSFIHYYSSIQSLRMNNKRSITYLVLIISTFLFSCSGPENGQNIDNALASTVSLGNNAANEKYIIDTKQTVLEWKASSPMGGHSGFVYISKGELMVENGQLAGGTVIIDMNTIEDEKHGRDNNLVNHLKDPDFFDVKKFPISTIVITKVESINAENKKITGNLTIKGITHSVAFPTKIEVKNGMIKADGKLMIDRTKWDVRYKSGKFFDDLKDQAIGHEIEFYVRVVGRK
jgi:polyisoprenoid-binding protein YceI